MKELFAEIDHTGVFKFEPIKLSETCPLFGMAYTYEVNGKRVRRFITHFSSN